MYIPAENYNCLAPAVARPRFQSEIVEDKGSGALMEDVLLRDENIFGVFDGATSLDGWISEEGVSGGLKAARIASRVFARNDQPLPLLASQANTAINAELIRQGIEISERHRLWSTSLAVVRIEADSFSWCQTGDSLIVLLDVHGGYRLLTPDIDLDCETLCLWKNSKNPQGLSIHELLSEQIIKVRQGMNRKYGVLNGEPEAMNFLRHGRESLAGIASILLFTDGLFLPKANPLSEGDWCSFVAMYRKGGLKEIHGYVRNLQRIDPDCLLFPRFKKHDDIAAIAIDLS